MDSDDEYKNACLVAAEVVQDPEGLGSCLKWSDRNCGLAWGDLHEQVTPNWTTLWPVIFVYCKLPCQLEGIVSP